MNAIARNLVPLIVRELCKCSLTEGAQHRRENSWETPIYDFRHFHLPNAAIGNVIEHMDNELGLVSLACEYATRAMSSYIKGLLTAMRSRRNRHLPVYRLPSEILVIVFRLAVESSSNGTRPLATKAPFNISHVSSRWREIAITTPRLWTKYDATSARVADIVLDRSKRAPLHVKLAQDDPDYFSDEESKRRCPPSTAKAYREGARNFSNFLRPLLPHTDRVEELILGDVEGSPWEHLRFPAPNLKKLEVIITEGDFDKPSTQVFVGTTPLLRDLRLWGYCPPLASSIYTGLTTLMLHDIYCDETVQDVLGVLAGCPRLKCLTLEDVELEPLENPSLLYIDIHLPYLEEVVLAFLGQEVTSSILSSITASPTVQLKLREADWEGSFLSDTFRSRLFSSNAAPICWARCKHAGYPRGAFAFDAGDFERGRRVKVVSPARAETAIPNLAQDLPIQSLESLAFEMMGQGNRLSVASFSHLLADLPYITSITLSYSPDPWPFVDALIVTPSSNLCPLLRELRIEGALEIVKETLLEFARSRTASNRHTPDGPHLTHLAFIRCAALDLPTELELRNLSLQVRVLASEWQIEDIKFSRVQS
ncbi:hypothetical protein BOTBODRAFT_67716 [Botryobasidium botryosum FD-172 SS1]|uniref:Uncharacterized protein n=1 Tax=Botryobasidium botryosum (strain FD-172 SS1) TaxID=930990 RepID=A0A067M901_BOTB1|nr:hypothetical protein BOTBODRAFT_67716 [Botryobasidium botryosum FD-172 SS1]